MNAEILFEGLKKKVGAVNIHNSNPNGVYDNAFCFEREGCDQLIYVSLKKGKIGLNFHHGADDFDLNYAKPCKTLSGLLEVGLNYIPMAENSSEVLLNDTLNVKALLVNIFMAIDTYLEMHNKAQRYSDNLTSLISEKQKVIEQITKEMQESLGMEETTHDLLVNTVNSIKKIIRTDF